MTARVEPVRPATLERTVQLIQRSNQFNLTTRRHPAADVLAMMDDDRWLTATVSLADRFGDNGLISVVLARIDDAALAIDTWLMSCRVLSRGVEQFVLNHLCGEAIGRGLAAIRGEYIPTARNALVRDHYATLGFRQTATDPDGHTSWELELSPGWQPLATFIEDSQGDG